MWYPVAGTTVPYLRNCGTRLLEQWCNSGRNLHYTLYHQLTAMNIRCVIMAPTTILRNSKRVKTDRIDAENLARCLAYGGYKSVYIPTAQDEAVRLAFIIIC